jgi:hypothetical protein
VTVVLRNIGVMGTEKVRLYLDGEEADSKWITMRAKERQKVSLFARPLYRPGAHQLAVGTGEPSIRARIAVKPISARFEYQRKAVSSNHREILPPGPVSIGSLVKNIGSYCKTETARLYVNGRVRKEKSLHLLPGEEKEVDLVYNFKKTGVHQVAIGTPHLTRSIRIGKKIAPPWFSFFSTQNANFCQIGQRLYINARGRNGYAVVYRKGFRGDFRATVKLVNQESTTQHYRAGLMVSSKLADPSSAEYVMLPVTREAGPHLEWQSSAGRIEFAGGGRPGKRIPSGSWCDGVYPIWLRLEKQGLYFVAAYSLDHITWTRMSEARISWGNQTQDIGVSVSPASHEVASLVEFESFRVE